MIAKQGLGLIKTALQVADACHANRDKGKFTGNCNVLTAADAKGTFAKVTQKATAAIDKKCLPNDAVRGNYGNDLPIASQLAAAARAQIEASGALLEPGPPFVGDKLRAKCRKAIGKSRAAIVNEIVKAAVRCQKTADKTAVAFGALQPSCVVGAIKSGPKALTTLAKACGAIADISCAPFPGCLVTSATATGQASAKTIYGGVLFASGLESDTDVLLLGEPDQASFRVKLGRAIPGAHIQVDEVNASGNVIGPVTELFDDSDAVHNDTTGGDGVFNNVVALGFATLGDHRYVATLTAPFGVHGATPPLTITVKAAPGNAQLQLALDTEAAIRQQAAAALAGGQDVQAVLDALQATLVAPPHDVAADRIERSDHAIAWENADGILSIVDTALLDFEPPAAMATMRSRAAATAPRATADDCKRARTISPYAYSFKEFDDGVAIAGRLEQAMWHVTRVKGDSLDHFSVEQFKNFGKQKLIAISSAGGTLPRSGAYFLSGDPVTLTAMASYGADLFNHRLAVADGWFAILPRFVTRYAGRLEKAIVYVGGFLNAAEDSSMADAFIGQGAASYMSYTRIVTLEQSRDQAITMIDTLTSPNKTVADIPGIDTGVFKEFGALDATLPTDCDLLRDHDLLVQYSWPFTQKDLDTQTLFLGEGVGFSCGDGNPYLHWGGDNLSSGGSEFTIVDLFAAYEAGLFTTETTVIAAAGWFTPSEGVGPATLTVALKNKETGETRGVTTKTIQPGGQTGCAATEVATIDITLFGGIEPAVQFELK